MLEELVQQFLFVKISVGQLYLLWFLLGSFTVATLSDLKHLSAQKEFLQIWALFVLVMFAADIYYHYYLGRNIVYLLVKWGLIFIFIPIYFHYIRRVAWGDVFAKMSACSLFSPIFIIMFIILVGIIDSITRSFWQKFGQGRFYPFMPVIFLTTIILLFISLFVFKNY